ncbi:MAG: intrarane metalloprotease, partial [Thermoleophilia bacterium]|nr:intrarane metalloprotease [Thermoleophilia bacterium]
TLERANVLIAMELIMFAGAFTLLMPLGGVVAAKLRDSRARVGAGMLMLLPILVLGVLLSILATALGDDPLIDRRLDLATGVALVVLATAIAVTEELWFRGLMMAGLGGERRPWLAIFASAVLFAAPHVDGSRASIANAGGVLLVIGIPFAVVRLLTHTLVPLIVVHAAVDAWAFLHTADAAASGSPSNGEIAASLILPALISGGYLLAFKLSAHRRTTSPLP